MVRFRPLAFALVVGAFSVLGAAGANAANLLLAQTAERSRELAIRQALGASEWAIVRQWCLQVGLLVLLAIGAGTLLARWAIDVVVASMPDTIKMTQLGVPWASISWRPWLIMVAIALATTPLIGLVPARQAARIALSRALRDGGGGALGKAKGRRTLRLLVGLQVALASALTFGAVSAYRGFVSARQAPLGFEPSRVTQLDVPNHATAPSDRAEFLERLAQRGLGDARAPAVTGGATAPGSPLLALVKDPPLTRMYDPQRFFLEGQARPTRATMPWGKRNRVSPNYFSLLGIPLLSGRAFAPADNAGAPCVAIFSRSLAASTFGDRDAVGQRIRLSGSGEGSAAVEGGRNEGDSDAPCEVIGVAGDVYDVLPGSPGDIYFPTAQSAAAAGTVLVRGASAAELGALKAEIRRFDPRQVIGEHSLVDRALAAAWGSRMLAGLFIALAGVGLSLAAVGTYAMLAHAAVVRRREFGLRAVLGAQPRQLAWLVMAEHLPIGALGVVIGVGVVAIGAFVVQRHDPGVGVYAVSGAIMAGLLGAAALLSARRVMTLEPGFALRRR
jgi:predicted permease